MNININTHISQRCKTNTKSKELTHTRSVHTNMKRHGTNRTIPFFLACLSLSLFFLTSTTSVSALKQFSVSKILELAKKQDSSSLKLKSKAKELQRLAGKDQDKSDVQELYLKQRLDHFTSYPSGDEHVPHSFSQRFFYTERFANTTDADADASRSMNTGTTSNTKKFHARHLRHGHGHGHIQEEDPPKILTFICVGGEGPSLDKTVLTNSPHCSGDMLALASLLSTERNAIVHVFALEHRYYGKSYPEFNDGSSPVTNENLVYLSSRQALADLAHFVQFAKEEYGIPQDSPVVTFGGSYPGMLAAWARLKYPHLIDAAVSNSAPIEVILDFTEYMDVYARSISNPAVGGSAQCLDLIHQGHEEIAVMLSEGGAIGKEYIASSFNICNGTDALKEAKNVQSFVGDGVVFFDVQSNDPSCEVDLCNIEKFCNFITEESNNTSVSIVEILAKLSNEMESSGECRDISWEGMISFLSSPEEAKVEGTRSWLWQTCTEVGFYQTCETNSTCPFARGYHTLDADLEICQRAFGIDKDFVKENVEDTLNYYGGWDISSSRILSVNGDVDPWSAMSYSNSGRKNRDLPSIWSNSSSHHFWTHEVKESDGPAIMETREIIYSWVTGVLFGDHHNDNVQGEQWIDQTTDDILSSK